jgi:hypothetical protein
MPYFGRFRPCVRCKRIPGFLGSGAPWTMNEKDFYHKKFVCGEKKNNNHF